MLHNNISSNIKFIYLITLLLSSCGGGGGNIASANGSSNSLCSSITYDAPSGAANNIVFTFDKPYSCGQFANGDWWVSQDSNGYVTITSISPPAAAGINGYEVNPTNTVLQAFDSSADIPYQASLMPPLPLQVSGTSSVVKAVSTTGRPQLKFVAVLTVVTSPINNSSEIFRPGYFGNTKNFYSTSSLRIASLPKYNALSIPSISSISIASIATRYRHVQFDHYLGWRGRDMHPADHMPDYGSDIARDNAVYLLRMLLSDFDYSIPAHKQALINYLQMAIDLQAAAIGGAATWPPDGGHGNGRKLPLLFAGWLFNNFTFNNAINASAFSEDLQIWRNNSGIALFGRPGTENAYWQDIRGLGGARDIRDPYGLIDGGSLGPGDAYQFCCTANPWKYTALALYMLGLTNSWANGNTTFIDYVERWVNSGAIALPDTCAPYDGSSANYGINYGPNGSGGCIAGGGRFPASHGINANSGFYGSTFGNDLWNWYKACMVGGWHC